MKVVANGLQFAAPFYLASKKVPNDFQFVWAFSTHQRNGQDESARHLSLRDNENI